MSTTPTTIERVSKAYRQIGCAREECDIPEVRDQLRDLSAQIAVLLTDLDESRV